MGSIDNIQALALDLSSEVSFGIQTLITGAIVIWHVPSACVDNLETLIKNELIVVDEQTARVLAMRNLTHEPSVYITHFEKVMTDEGKGSNLRFSAKYNGPDLRKPIPGVLTSKRDISILLRKIAERSIVKAKESQLETYTPNMAKPVTVSIVTRYCKIVGKFSGYQMIYTIIPQRESYIPWLEHYMPPAIANIAIEKVSTKSNQIVYRVNAAGKPYLARVGRVADDIIGKAIIAVAQAKARAINHQNSTI